jgi:hypothetical protein
LRETDRLRELIGERHRWYAVRAHLHELDGDLPAAATAYAEAALRVPKTSSSLVTAGSIITARSCSGRTRRTSAAPTSTALVRNVKRVFIMDDCDALINSAAFSCGKGASQDRCRTATFTRTREDYGL